MKHCVARSVGPLKKIEIPTGHFVAHIAASLLLPLDAVHAPTTLACALSPIDSPTRRHFSSPPDGRESESRSCYWRSRRLRLSHHAVCPSRRRWCRRWLSGQPESGGGYPRPFSDSRTPECR